MKMHFNENKFNENTTGVPGFQEWNAWNSTYYCFNTTAQSCLNNKEFSNSTDSSGIICHN